MTELRQGRLSAEEIQYIRDNLELPVGKLASILRRRVEPVQAKIDEILAERQAEQDKIERAKYDVTTRHFWIQLQSEFNDDELNYCKTEWAKLMSQFSGDVTHTEELQMLSACRLSVLMSRTLRKSKQAELMAEKTEEALRKELERENPDTATIAGYQATLAALRAASSAATNEYDKLFNDHSKILKDMRGTREQRVKEIEDRRVTFFEMLRHLNKEHIRRRESEDMELRRLAMIKEEQRMSQPHRYVDGQEDIPILTPENVEGLNEGDNLGN